MEHAVEAKIMAKVEQKKLAAESLSAPDTGTKSRTRKNSKKDTDKIYEEIRIHRQENVDFKTSVKTELRKKTDRMDEEFKRFQTIIDTIRQLLGKTTDIGLQKEPESGNHDAVLPREEHVPEGPTKAAEITIAEKELEGGNNRKISYLRETRAEMKTEVEQIVDTTYRKLKKEEFEAALDGVETAKRRQNEAEVFYARLRQIVGFHKDDRRANDTSVAWSHP